MERKNFSADAAAIQPLWDFWGILSSPAYIQMSAEIGPDLSARSFP